MKSVFWATTLPLTLFATPAVCQEAIPPQPSVRDMYVSCYNLINDVIIEPETNGHLQKYNSLHCALATARVRSLADDSDRRICFSDGIAFSMNPSREIAVSYIEFVEKNLSALSIAGGLNANDARGYDAVILAANLKWPCEQ